MRIIVVDNTACLFEFDSPSLLHEGDVVWNNGIAHRLSRPIVFTQGGTIIGERTGEIIKVCYKSEQAILSENLMSK